MENTLRKLPDVLLDIVLDYYFEDDFMLFHDSMTAPEKKNSFKKLLNFKKENILAMPDVHIDIGSRVSKAYKKLRDGFSSSHRKFSCDTCYHTIYPGEYNSTVVEVKLGSFPHTKTKQVYICPECMTKQKLPKYECHFLDQKMHFTTKLPLHSVQLLYHSKKVYMFHRGLPELDCIGSITPEFADTFKDKVGVQQVHLTGIY